MAALSGDALRGDAGAVAAFRKPPRRRAARSDRDLMTELARGDERALGELYDRFAPMAHALALRVLHDRELAEDAVQEAFVSVWRFASRFDPERGPVQSWVLMLVHRRSVDLVHRNQRFRDKATEETLELYVPSAAEAAELKRDRGAVQAALAALPPKQRAALRHAYYGGYTQPEIANRLGVPVGTIKSQMFEGLRRLRLLLEPSSRRSAW